MMIPDLDPVVFSSYDGLVLTPPANLELSHNAAVKALVRCCEIDLDVITEELTLTQDAHDVLVAYDRVDSLSASAARIAWLAAERDRADLVLQLARRAQRVGSFVA